MRDPEDPGVQEVRQGSPEQVHGPDRCTVVPTAHSSIPGARDLHSNAALRGPRTPAGQGAPQAREGEAGVSSWGAHQCHPQMRSSAPAHQGLPLPHPPLPEAQGPLWKPASLSPCTSANSGRGLHPSAAPATLTKPCCMSHM